MYPKEYEHQSNSWKRSFKKAGRALKKCKKCSHHILRTEGIKFLEITGRVKTLYSLYNKLKKYDNDITKIHDIIALSIITKSTADCYARFGRDS